MAAPSLIQTAREAMALHSQEARAAYSLFVTHCEDRAPCRVPGMDTVTRLAIRVHQGQTVEEAAAREYLYRWRLAIQSPVFGIPHALGL